MYLSVQEQEEANWVFEHFDTHLCVFLFACINWDSNLFVQMQERRRARFGVAVPETRVLQTRRASTQFSFSASCV